MDNSLKISVPLMLRIVIFAIMLFAFGTWAVANKVYTEKNLAHKQQLHLHEQVNGKTYPHIAAKNLSIKQGTHINIRDHVSAWDDKDGNISHKIAYYGSVLPNQKGEYKIRLVVRNSYGLKTAKTMSVIVY